jgi:hypothetical protein
LSEKKKKRGKARGLYWLYVRRQAGKQQDWATLSVCWTNRELKLSSRVPGQALASKCIVNDSTNRPPWFCNFSSLCSSSREIMTQQNVSIHCILYQFSLSCKQFNWPTFIMTFCHDIHDTWINYSYTCYLFTYIQLFWYMLSLYVIIFWKFE